MTAPMPRFVAALALCLLVTGCGAEPAVPVAVPIKDDPATQQGYVAAVRAITSERATDEAILDGGRLACEAPIADVGDPGRLKQEAVVGRGFTDSAAGTIAYYAGQWLCPAV